MINTWLLGSCKAEVLNILYILCSRERKRFGIWTYKWLIEFNFSLYVATVPLNFLRDKNHYYLFPCLLNPCMLLVSSNTHDILPLIKALLPIKKKISPLLPAPTKTSRKYLPMTPSRSTSKAGWLEWGLNLWVGGVLTLTNWVDRHLFKIWRKHAFRNKALDYI